MLVCGIRVSSWILLRLPVASCPPKPHQQPPLDAISTQVPAAAVPAPRKTPSTPEERDGIIFDQLQGEKGTPGALRSLLAKPTSVAFPGRHAL